LKVLQVTLFIRPFIHSLNQVFEILFQVGIDAEIQCIVIGRENRGGGRAFDCVEERSDEMRVVNFKGEFFEDIPMSEIVL
jgi:hypothetical protein